MFEPLDAVVWGGSLGSAVELARHRLVERVDQQRRFAAAGYTGDASEQAEWDLGVDVLEIVAARIDQRQRAPRVSRSALGNCHRHLAREIFAGERGGRRDQIVERALCDDVSAVDAGTGPDVEYV